MRKSKLSSAEVFELRQFRSGDGEAVWKLHDAALEDAGVHGGRGPWEDDLRDIPGTYIAPGGDFLVCLAGKDLVGMGGLLRRSPEEAQITRMRVHPDFQRRGLGRLILEELEARARALGCRAIHLNTTSRSRRSGVRKRRLPGGRPATRGPLSLHRLQQGARPGRLIFAPAHLWLALHTGQPASSIGRG